MPREVSPIKQPASSPRSEVGFLKSLLVYLTMVGSYANENVNNLARANLDYHCRLQLSETFTGQMKMVV